MGNSEVARAPVFYTVQMVNAGRTEVNGNGFLWDRVSDSKVVGLSKSFA